MAALKAEPYPKDVQDPTRSFGKVFEMLGIVALFLLAVVWFGGAYPNRDPAWFSTDFTAQPSIICFYYHGQVRALRPSDPTYAEWVARLNREMVRHDGYAESVHPGGEPGNLTNNGCQLPAAEKPDQTLTHYRLKGIAIELEYATNVQVHAPHFFPEARRLMLALEGNYSYIHSSILFRGSPKEYLPSGLIIQEPTETLNALNTLFAAP